MAKQLAELKAICGSKLGRHLLMVERNPIDLAFSDKVKEGKTNFRKPYYKYGIKPIEIEEVRADRSSNNNDVIIFNDNPDLRMIITDTTTEEDIFPIPNTRTIRDAIAKKENDGSISIFCDWPKLFKEVAALNREEETRIQEDIKQMLNWINVLKETNEAEKIACEKAMRDIGIQINL